MSSLIKYPHPSIEIEMITLDEIISHEDKLDAEELPNYQDCIGQTYTSHRYTPIPTKLDVNIDIKETPMWLKLLEADDKPGHSSTDAADDDNEDAINLIIAFFMAITLTLVLVTICHTSDTIYDKNSETTIFCLLKDFQSLGEYEQTLVLQYLNKVVGNY